MNFQNVKTRKPLLQVESVVSFSQKFQLLTPALLKQYEILKLSLATVYAGINGYFSSRVCTLDTNTVWVQSWGPITHLG